MKNQLGTLRPSLSIYFRVALLAFCLMTMGVGNVWGWNLADGRKVYFNMQNQTDFGTPYFRIGRQAKDNNWSAATEMTTVPGTKYLFVYTQSGEWSNYGAFSVANGKGFTGGNDIYQPWSGQPGSAGYSGDVEISKQIFFQKYDVTDDCYLEIKSANGSESNGCQYYDVNAQTTDNGGSLVTDIPMYSVTFANAQSHGTISVQKYTKTDGSTKESISTGDEVYPTQIIEITATPDANYALAGSLSVTGATLISGTTYYVMGNCVITATFAPRWNIKGSMDDGWSEFHPMTLVSESDFSGTIELTAHTAYRFKVFDRLNDGRSFGCGTREHDYTYVGQTEEVPLQAANNHTLVLMTTVGGDYTFNWDSTAKTLQIVYPTAIKHPSMDYVYMEKYSGWASGKSCNIHYWYTEDETDYPFSSNGEDPKITTGTPVKHEWTGLAYDTAFYTFPVLEDYPKFKAADNASGGTGSNHTSDDGMVTTGHEGHYVYHNGSAWVWHTIQVYIELENNGADVKKGDLGRNVAFNDTSMNTAIVCPQKSHYDFGGYYTEDGGTGTQIINASGEWQTDKTDYFNASGKWIHAGDTTKLYAKWTRHQYTISLSVEPAGAGTISPSGATMFAYNDLASGDITATPSHAAWKFKEWRFSKVGESDYDVYVTNDETYHSSDATIQVYAKRNGTLTAVFEPRFTLVGATEANSEVTGGMPGWSDYTKEFTVNSTSPSVNLTCTCSLNANTWYKFQIHDRIAGNFGDGTDGKYELVKGNKAHCTKSNMDMKFLTTGAAKYVFQIDEIDGDGRPYVKLLWPWQVNFGWKYQDADAGSLSEGGGGTVTAYVHEGETKTAISSGGWMMHGDSVSFTAHPYNDYQLAGWWNDYDFSYKTILDGDSVHWTVTTENAQLYAKFVEKTDTLKSGTTWSDGTWSTGSQPTADIVAVIKSPVQVDITDAEAKKVLIMKNGGNTGQLEIPAGKELMVRTTIKKTTDGSTYGATGENDIIIGSTLAEGNGALVMGAHDGTNKATVYFAIKAKTVTQDGNKHSVNQFIGTPFNDQGAVLYNYYGTKLYRFMAAKNGQYGDGYWDKLSSSDGMLGFYGYNILTNQTESPVLEMTGTLSRTNTTETISGHYEAGSDSTENMFANSWVAPIYIPNFEDDDFVNIEKTIYIFNAGTVIDQGVHSTADGTANNTTPGQYSVLPIHASPWVGMKVIPSMQAFSVFAKGADPKLKFNYTNLVRDPSNGTAPIVPNRAPKRTNEEDAPTVLKMRATGESGYAANVVMLEREGLSEGFDDGWDGRFIPGDEAAPQLYAVTSDGNMAINSVLDMEGTVLGFKAGTDDTYTFAFEYDGDALYLFDTQTQIYTRVLTGNTYVFTTADDAAHNRFILTRNAPQTPTEVDNTNADAKAVKFIENDRIYIFRAGVLYDAIGNIVK